MEYTVGKFAKKLGVTKRTLHHYDEIGLFKPSIITSTNHRVYTDEDISKFQKIVTLKYIGFTLDEIEKIINSSDSMYESLVYQRSKLDNKRRNLEKIISSLDGIISMGATDDNINWDNHFDIVQLINQEKGWIYDSQTLVNWKHRISIYDKYSPSGNNWKEWIFDHIDFNGMTNILELASGDGSIWKKNITKIPEGLDITLSDISPEMINSAKENLSNVGYDFKFMAIDMENIPFSDSSLDMIIVEHALYLSVNVEKALSEIRRVLKPKGKLYTTLISKEHFQEVKKILFDYKKYKMAGSDRISYFCFENTIERFEKYFNVLGSFDKKEILEVTDSKLLVNYVVSCGDAHLKKLSITEKNRLAKHMDVIIMNEGKISITNYNGLYVLEKGEN